MTGFDDEFYLAGMAALARREQAGEDLSFGCWQVELVISYTNLMMLARDMANELGEEHPLTQHFRAWSREAVKLAVSPP